MKIEESIGRYIYGYDEAPKPNNIVVMSEKMMAIADEMEEFFQNVPDDRKRELLNRNVSMMRQRMVENLEIFNEWATKQ